MREVAYLSLIFTLTWPNLLPTTYYLLPTTYYLPPKTYYLPPTTYNLQPTHSDRYGSMCDANHTITGILSLSRTGPKSEHSTFRCSICSNFTDRTWRMKIMTTHSQGSCERVPCDLWVELKQILHLKVGCSDFGKYQAQVCHLFSSINFVDNGVIWGADYKYDAHLWRK